MRVLVSRLPEVACLGGRERDQIDNCSGQWPEILQRCREGEACQEMYAGLAVSA